MCASDRGGVLEEEVAVWKQCHFWWMQLSCYEGNFIQHNGPAVESLPSK